MCAALAQAAEVETFHGWSKDGSWLVYEQRFDDDRGELYFCATDAEVQPTWPVALHEADRLSGPLSCVRFLDPNKAPYQWKSQLLRPSPPREVTVELATEGDELGWVVARGKERQLCPIANLAPGATLEQSWLHPSGRYAAAMIDGRLVHCALSAKRGKTPVKSPPRKKK